MPFPIPLFTWWQWPQSTRGWHRATGLGRQTLPAFSRDRSWQGVLTLLRLPTRQKCLAGRRLAYFSDLHWCQASDRPAAGLVAFVNDLAADWLAFGGDLYRHPAHRAAALAILGQLQAKHGKIAVVGNWERYRPQPLDELRAEFAGAGFRLLVNELLPSRSAAEPLFLGLDDPRHGQPDLRLGEGVASAQRTLVSLCHSPVGAVHAASGALGQLVLCGHTHGGQIRLPLFGPLFSSTPYGRRLDRGLFHRAADDAWLYVSQGVGTTGPRPLRRRLLCPPEVVLVEFVPTP